MNVCNLRDFESIDCANSEVCRKYKHTRCHITWDKKKVFYSHTDELKFAIKLDVLKTRYEVNALQIIYYDYLSNKEKVSIPNFYLPDDNTIIEVRNEKNYNKSEIYDKFTQYIINGYESLLVYDLTHILTIDTLNSI